MKHIENLKISFNDKEVGYLYIGDKGKIYFQYTETWLKNGFNLSPFDLKMIKELQAPRDNLFSGLHGIFADSISDGWGLMLIDRALQKKFSWEKNSITQLDRLFFMGNRAMGGLEYSPNDKKETQIENFNIEHIFKETEQILSGQKEEIIKELYLSGGSPGGARPKAVFARSGEEFITGYSNIPEGYKGWIIKFFSSVDTPSTGKIEKAYADMAKDCSINMPETDLIKVNIDKKEQSFFAIERFDRNSQTRNHIASFAGLVYASHRIPSVSYKDIFSVTRELTKDKQELDKLFNIMLFNILMHNQDDHTKNFSYQYTENNWKLTPSYDLVYSVGPGNQHMSDIGGNGNPNYQDIKKIAQHFDIINVDDKIENIISVSQNWKEYSDKYEIPKKEMKNIEKSLEHTLQNFNFSKSLKLKLK